MTAPDAVRLACEITGSGPPLVMVHGAGSARWAFGLLRPHLEGDFKVVAPDRRGRGASSDSGGYALERELDDLGAVMADAGEAALLFGHSYGGLVAATAAPRLKALPALVLYEPPMGGVLASAERVDGWEALIEAGERDRVVREFMAEVGGYDDAQIDELAATPLWEKRVEIVHTMPRELRAEAAHTLDAQALAALDLPVLMLVGSHSPAWAVRSTRAYAEALPQATVRTLEGQGHGATSYAPELVAGELRRFLGPAGQRRDPGSDRS